MLVSAQVDGVEGLADDLQGLIYWDNERYGSLHVPHNAYSYDIYTQAARMVGPERSQLPIDPLPGLNVTRLIGVGASQSGSMISTYINGINPREQVFDALVPLVSAGTAENFGAGRRKVKFKDLAAEDPDQHKAEVVRTHLRTDGETKIFAMNSETESVFYYGMRQPDSEKFVYWEVAGASHGGEKHIMELSAIARRDGMRPFGEGTASISKVLWKPTLGAAYRHIHRWINGGEAPPSQPPIEYKPGLLHLKAKNLLVAFAATKASLGLLPQIKRDKYGNAKGGVRLPELEVPVATYRGLVGSLGLLGSTKPLKPKVIESLYPTHEDYVSKVEAAAYRALEQEVITEGRVKEYIEEAQSADIP